MDAFSQLMLRNPVIAVLVVDELSDAVPLAEALVKGGVTSMELTLRTPVALDALRAVREKVPEMTAGVGTVLTREQLRDAKSAGAAFGVAPGVNRNVLEEAATQNFPFAPGVATPSDIEAALEFGCRILKFFPAEPSGGLAYLKSMAAPYLHMGISFVPLGGINEGNFRGYLESPIVAGVGGSWIAPRDLIRSGDWGEITRRAHTAAEAVAEICGK